MLKKVLLPLLGILSLAACDETPPHIEYGSTQREDTTYVTSVVETPQARKVLMEEFTGVSCPPCPNGHRMIDTLEHHYPGRFVAVGFSPYGFPQTDPVHDLTKQDFRTQDATTLKDIFVVSAIPAAVIDRIPGSIGYPQGVQSWAASVGNRINVSTKVNLHMTSVYNPGTREASVVVRAHYTGGISKKQVMTVLLLENEIIDAQKNGLQIDTNYTHRHVMRQMFTRPATGSPMMDDIADKGVGRVYERRFTVKVDQAWNPDNCKLVAWISNAEPSDKEVQQSEEIDLK